MPCLRSRSFRLFILVLTFICKAASGLADEPAQPQGMYFSKKTYVPAPLPQYADIKDRLPSPIYDDNPLWISIYWKAWELASRNFHEPKPGSGFVSQFIDAAFSQNIFLYDSSFMTMFTTFGAPLVPGISTLDNFYAKQEPDGEIEREYIRDTGKYYDPWVNHEGRSLFSRDGWTDGVVSYHTDFTYRGRTPPNPNPIFTLDALDHPILAWAEIESYRVTGDRNRLAMVWEPLVHYYAALQKYLRQGNGLYVTDWASMDNSPRNPYLKGGGTGVDISSEMVLFARNLAEIAGILGKDSESKQYSRDAEALSATIRQRMWNKHRNFYFDLTLDDQYAPVKTIAAYWTLVAHVASARQARYLVSELRNPKTFGRPSGVPTLAADEPLYDPEGGYWKGSVWAPTETMVIRGLSAYGYHDLARQLAIEHLNLVADVYQKTGTIWENYAPDEPTHGRLSKPDFVGWSGIGPILYLIEYAIGLRPDAAHNQLFWELRSGGRRGCERFRFNGHVVSLIAKPDDTNRLHISVESDGEFSLKVQRGRTSKTFRIKKGQQELTIQ